MSWSFSVTEKTQSDVVRVFENTVIENRQSIPDDIGSKLKDAARVLTNDTPDMRKVTLSSSGHKRPDGCWNASISIIVAEKREDWPEEPAEPTVEDPEDADTNSA